MWLFVSVWLLPLHFISSFPFIPNAHSSLLLHRSGTSSDGLRVCASTYSCLCKKWSVVMSIYVLSAYLVFLWRFVSSSVLLFSVGCISSSDGPWVGPHLLLWWTMIWWSYFYLSFYGRLQRFLCSLVSKVRQLVREARILILMVKKGDYFVNGRRAWECKSQQKLTLVLHLCCLWA